MRRLTGVLATLLLFGQATYTQVNQQDQILRVREKVWRAWFAGDEATLRELVSDDAVVISAGQTGWKNLAAVVREAREFRSGGGSLLQLQFPRTEVQWSQNSAFVYSDYILEIATKTRRTVTRGRATEVFMLRSGKWWNTGWHTDQQ